MNTKETKRSVLSVIGKTLLAGFVASTAVLSSSDAKADPPTPWSAIAPTLSPSFQPGSPNICNRGDNACVDSVVAEMQRREAPLDAACSHSEIFALTYLRTTEEYRVSALTPGFFQDPAFINHQDALFAKYYFDAWDKYRAGQTSQVSPAWRTAFQAADQKRVSALGNLLLGMSAHVNRDLPYVLAAIGLTKPDGTSRKPDHDKVNDFLRTVMQPLLEEIEERFDPTIGLVQFQGTTLDEEAFFQILVAWREQAWHNAELIVAAGSNPIARALVDAQIEAVAATEANAILVATSYTPISALFGVSRAARDAYCAAHG